MRPAVTRGGSVGNRPQLRGEQVSPRIGPPKYGDATLVTDGPYRWVRHPFYLAFALVVLANSLINASAYLAITGLAAFLVMVARTSIEEQKLLERFSPACQNYMQRTGRFLPRIR